MEKIRHIPFDRVTLTDGFWADRQKIVREVSVGNVYKRFKETGRFDAFRFEWKEGMPDKPHIFWDSDIAKWIESVAFLAQKKREPELEAIVDEVVDLIEKNQKPDGYFNIYFTVCEPEARFTRRTDHELYDAGHLIEAAVAYYFATGKRKFMDLMCKYADLIDKTFRVEKSAKFLTPGHEEIELALVKLSEATGERRYLELSKYFVDTRGTDDEATYDWAKQFYNQSHLPVREQKTAEGHSVRAVYLYSGMADIAREYDDETLFRACDTLFDNIAYKRMFVTGGIGSSAAGEMFTVDYDLPNKHAYSESCAALGLALFARRMTELNRDAKYADVVERIIYNGFLSSISLDGKSFFYENPLEVDMKLHRRNEKLGIGGFPPPHRFEVFGCSCCPPNITRFIASIGDFLYNCGDGVILVNQYMQSEAAFETDGGQVKLTQRTKYPVDGVVELEYSGAPLKLAFRIPEWCDSFTLTKNNAPADFEPDRGYVYTDAADGDKFTLSLAVDAYMVEANPLVQNDCGRVAVFRGPVLFCAEGCDNQPCDCYKSSGCRCDNQPCDCINTDAANLHDIRIIGDEFKCGYDEALGVMTLETDAYRTAPVSGLYIKPTDECIPVTLRLIPYYAFANRGDTDMLVWLTRG